MVALEAKIGEDECGMVFLMRSHIIRRRALVLRSRVANHDVVVSQGEAAGRVPIWGAELHGFGASRSARIKKRVAVDCMLICGVWMKKLRREVRVI